MSVDVRWYDDSQQIIYYEFQKGWDWPMVSNALQQGRELADSVQHDVDCIVDLTRSGMFMPKGVFAFARHYYNNAPIDNMKMTVVVGPRFVKSLGDTSAKLTGQGSKWPMHFVTSMTEALDYLEQIEGVG